MKSRRSSDATPRLVSALCYWQHQGARIQFNAASAVCEAPLAADRWQGKTPGRGPTTQSPETTLHLLPTPEKGPGHQAGARIHGWIPCAGSVCVRGGVRGPATLTGYNRPAQGAIGIGQGKTVSFQGLERKRGREATNVIKPDWVRWFGFLFSVLGQNLSWVGFPPTLITGPELVPVKTVEWVLQLGAPSALFQSRVQFWGLI